MRCRKMKRENTILFTNCASTFSHSLGQKLKSSRRAYVFRFAAKNGHPRVIVALMIALAVMVAG